MIQVIAKAITKATSAIPIARGLRKPWARPGPAKTYQKATMSPMMAAMSLRGMSAPRLRFRPDPQLPPAGEGCRLSSTLIPVVRQLLERGHEGLDPGGVGAEVVRADP